ncbi:MAG: DNA polymerase III subunit gamma/tau, partial [Oscillospiraceae bacterium]
MYDLLVGNERLKETVKSMITSGRIPHAIIIDGEDGFGKHTLASIIAAAANCEEMNPPCGKCRTCDLIRRYGFVDMEIYSPDG